MISLFVISISPLHGIRHRLDTCRASAVDQQGLFASVSSITTSGFAVMMESEHKVLSDMSKGFALTGGIQVFSDC